MTVTGDQLSLQRKGTVGQSGTIGPSGAGAQGLWNPTDNGCLAWSVDPGQVSGGGQAWGAGYMQLMAAKMQTDSVITKIGLALRSTAAAGLANTYLGIYTVSGTTATLIGSTPDISSSMNGVATQTFFNLSTPTTTLTAGTKFFFGLLFGSATTAPALQGVATIANAFISSKANYRSLVSPAAGITTLPSTIDLTTYVNPAVVLCAVAA